MTVLADLNGFVFLVVGAARDVELSASETVGDGTLTIVDAAGATVTSAAVTAGVCTVTVGSSVQVGADYLARWSVTIGGESRIVAQYCIIASCDLGIAPIVSDTVSVRTGLAPRSGSDWEQVISAAWARVLIDLRAYWPSIRRSGVLETAAALTRPLIHAADSGAYRVAGAYVGGVYRDWYDEAERQYRAAWADLVLPIDTDGDGVADVDPVRAQLPAFPPPSPASRR